MIFRKLALPLLAVFFSPFLLAQSPDYIQLKSLKSNEFGPISKYLEGVSVVGMGESTHGTHEFFISRTELFKYLVTEFQFNTLFLEADYATCLPIDDYIKGADGNVEDLIKGIKLWPWMTGEMVELIEWMRSYNSRNPDNIISLVGVDVQKFNETVTTLAKVLDPFDIESLTQLALVSNDEFYSFKKADIKKKISSKISELANFDLQFLSVTERNRTTILLRYLSQIAECQSSKNNSCRDIKMGENLLYHLENSEIDKGLFWAHNIHIANWYNEKKQRGVAGGVVKHHLKDKYLSIGQEFYEGSFNVYYINENVQNQKEKEKYTLGSVTVGPAAPGSFAANLKKGYSLPLFVPFDQLPEIEEVNITNIGARYVVDNNPKSIWRYNHHGQTAFDAILLIDKSTPTYLLD